MKNNKGITLIALVITIIVMLILVGVTISMAVNGGLFEYAGNAVRETNTKLQEEGQLAEGGIKVGGEWYGSIDEYLQSQGLSSTGLTATTISKNLKKYLGQTIAYGVEYGDASSYGDNEWEIYYADGEHIYIITRGHLADASLTTTGYNGTSDFTAENLQSKYKAVAAGLLNKTYDPTAAGTDEDPYLKYESSYANMKATQYLLDSTVWAIYANEHADWAIGAATLELFVKSYNAYYPDKAVTLETPTFYGYSYPLSESGAVPIGNYLSHRYSPSSYPYTTDWLACPSSTGNDSVCFVFGLYSRLGSTQRSSCNPFRPVVRLSSDVQITWDEETSAYTISKTSAT